MDTAGFGFFWNTWRYEGDRDFGFNLQGYVHQAKQMMPLFYVLQDLIGELPRLNALELTGCSSEMTAMAAALVEEKLGGVSLNLWQKWSDLLREARERGSEHITCFGDEFALNPWDNMDHEPSYSVWEDITLLEEAHHGRIKIDSYL